MLLGSISDPGMLGGPGLEVFIKLTTSGLAPSCKLDGQSDFDIMGSAI